MLTWQFDNVFAPIGAPVATNIPTLSTAALAALAAFVIAAAGYTLRRRM